jgi:hypothetical protein
VTLLAVYCNDRMDPSTFIDNLIASLVLTVLIIEESTSRSGVLPV